MKRLLALILAVCLLLCCCSANVEESTTAPTETTAAPTTEPTTVPMTEPPTETTEVTEPAPVDTNPLTGEALEAVSDIRPTAIMINNTSKASPQAGLSKADIVYEILAEGSITRFMAIYTDLASVGEIGPVRSIRPYYVRIAQGYDVVIFSAGGSEEALNMLAGSEYDYLNALSTVGSYFYRDEWRRVNRGYEHSLMTTGEKLAAAIEAKNVRATEDADVDYGLTFDDSVVLEGDAAGKITIKFYNKSTVMNYDAEQNIYAMYQHGADAVDVNDDTPITFRNVVILEASTKTIDSYGRLSVENTGSGDGWYARDGVIIPIKWSRDSYDDQYVYTDLEGNPISFGVGKSYIALVPDLDPVTFSE